MIAAARFGSTFIRESGSPMPADIANGLIRGAVLATRAVLVSRVSGQNAQLARKVKQLEGLIPICTHCQRILNEEKHWTRLETYIVEHSQAEFTHGICPECAKVHYGLIAPNDAVFLTSPAITDRSAQAAERAAPSNS